MRFLAPVLIILLAGCGDDRSFDKHYDETANDLQNRAAEIDSDLGSTNNGSQDIVEPPS